MIRQHIIEAWAAIQAESARKVEELENDTTGEVGAKLLKQAQNDPDLFGCPYAAIGYLEVDKLYNEGATVEEVEFLIDGC